MIDRKTFCFDIHHTVSLKFYNNNIKIGPCCQASHADLSVTEYTQDLGRHPFLQDLRRQNTDQNLIPSACSFCVKIEHSGLDSRRSNHLKYYTDNQLEKPGVRMLDIRLPNLCNLKCTICGAHDSTSWLQDARELGIDILDEWKYNKSIKHDVKNLRIPETLETIKFWGGEPLLDSLHLDVLRAIDQAHILDKQRIIYNTNGTVCVSEEVLSTWSKAQLVEIYFSIDDIGSRFNYQRFGGDWDVVNNNLRWYYNNLPNNHMMYISCSYSWLNVWNLPRVVDWHRENFATSRFGDPIKLIFNPVLGKCAIDKISPEFFSELSLRYQGYPELQDILKSLVIQPDFSPDGFLQYIFKLDRIRNTNYFTTFAEHPHIL